MSKESMESGVPGGVLRAGVVGGECCMGEDSTARDGDGELGAGVVGGEERLGVEGSESDCSHLSGGGVKGGGRIL